MRTAVLLLAACGAPSAAAPTLDNHAAPSSTYLVWNSDDDGGHATTVEVDETGRVLGRHDGIEIYAAGTRWRVRTRKVTSTMKSCDQLDRWTPGPPGGGAEDGTIVELVPEAGGAPLPLDARPDNADSDTELTWSAKLMASDGPYLFVQTYDYEYGCGAHGGEEYEARAIDLRTRRDVPAPEPDEDLASQAATQLEIPDMGGQLVEWIPSWSTGDAQLRELYEVDTCFACGNGLWSSYTSAVWMDAGDLPPALAALPPVPRPVAALAQGAHAGVSWGP